MLVYEAGNFGFFLELENGRCLLHKANVILDMEFSSQELLPCLWATKICQQGSLPMKYKFAISNVLNSVCMRVGVCARMHVCT